MMVKMIHKPSGIEKELNQTAANRLLAYSEKNNRGWERVDETKKRSKAKKNEDTNAGSSIGDSK